jgi:hypothetical protein
MILGVTDQKLWVFDVFRQSLGSQKTLNLKKNWVGFLTKFLIIPST